MKAARFDYVRPGDVGEALAALAKADGAKLLAGGQSLGPMLNLRLARPSLLVDVSRLESLARVDDIGSAFRIGASVTHSRIEDMRGRLAGGELLCEVAAGIAYRAIRNRGTIGGGITHADPAADWLLALAALGAMINIRAIGGVRSIPVEQFVLGAFSTALRDNEIIETIRPSSRAQGATAITSFAERQEILPKRARRPCSIRRTGPRASISARFARCLSRSGQSHRVLPEKENQPPRGKRWRGRLPTRRAISIQWSVAWWRPSQRVPCSRYLRDVADRTNC